MRVFVKRPLVIAIIGAVVVLVAVLLAFFALEGEAPTAPESSPAKSSAQEPQSPPLPTQPAPKAETSSVPAFDVVRIDPQGNTVVAGTAAPGAKVTILDGDKALGTVTANGDGEWVFLPDAPLPSGSRELTLSAQNQDGTTDTSKDVVVLVVPDGEGGKSLAVKTARDGGNTVVLQGEQPLDPKNPVAVDSVDYDEDGALTIGGRAKTGDTVAVYLDNSLLGSAKADENGRWQLAPQSTATLGSHKLRADVINDSGKVLARAELPFSRVELPSMPDGKRVVVQPGNSLWLLARRAYGDGKSYTVIYDANKGQIQNPDLIYPGQVFIMPKDSAH